MPPNSLTDLLKFHNRQSFNPINSQLNLQVFKMHLFASLILPATILAAPLSLAAQREGEMAGLIPRSRITCKIVNDNGEGGWGVKCRDRPDFSGKIVYDGLDNGESYTFSCYKSGDCYKGNW
jgi:hypothetical protein